MRISEFLRASFVGALLFSPAMADDIEQVHDEALRVLRETLGQSNGGAAPATKNAPSAADPEVARMRADREARIKAEAQQRMIERDRIQAERRREFEQYVKDRERLRQQQREYDQNAARQTGLVKESDSNDVHARALDALHQAQAQHLGNGAPQAAVLEPSSQQPSAATAQAQAPSVSSSTEANSEVTQRALEIIRENNASTATPGNAARLTEAEVAPRIVAAATAVPLQPANTDVHTRALEVLRGQTEKPATVSAPAAPAQTNSSAAPQPSPYLQQRLKEIQEELNQPQKKTSSSSIPDSYVKDLEQRAREGMATGTAATAATPSPAPAGPPASPSLDERTRQILQRQDRETSGRIAATPAPPRTAPSAVAGSLSPEQEAKAREALRREQSALQSQPSNAVVAAAPVPHATVTEDANIQYSKELEERARQILIERAQAQQSAVTVVTPAPASIPTPAPSAPAATAAPAPQSVTPAPAVTSSPSESVAEVHTRALETLNQAQANIPKSKMQRIRELTDLYRADKMGPAEYHQKRAQILAEPQ